MTVDDYQNFKKWLIDNYEIIKSSDIHKQIIDKCDVLIQSSNYIERLASNLIGTLYSHNMFILKYIVEGKELRDLILAEDYNTLYSVRHHYRYSKGLLNDLLLSMYFEYLGFSYEKYEEYESTLTLSKHTNTTTLFIYNGKITCLKYKHPIKDIKASIITDLDEPIYTHASFCEKCQIAFIHKQEYIRLRKRYPFLVAHFCELSDNGYTPIKKASLAAESPLMLCGYNVKNNVLSTFH